MLCFDILLTFSILAGAIPEPDIIQRTALDARRQIVSGDIVYELFEGIPTERENWEPEWKLLLRDHLVFDTRNGWHAFLERWRADEPVVVKNGKALIQRAPGGGHFERIVVSPEHCYQYFPDKLTDGAGFGITSDDPQSNPIEAKIVMHPWRFGLIPENFGIQHKYPVGNLGAYVAPSDQLDRSIAEDNVDGASSWRITFRRPDNRTVTTWIDPAGGMNVRKVVEEGATKHGPFVASVVSELKHYPEANVWFPERIVYSGISNGNKKNASHEKITVTSATYNIDIDPSQFTVKALSAAPHTLIAPRKPEAGLSQEWNGEKVAPLRPIAEKPIKTPPARASWRQFLLILGFILTFAAAVAWLSIKRHPRR